MSDEISLLPESLRGKEEKAKAAPSAESAEERLKMYIPQPEEEDIEVIEVDEDEVGQILEGEPLLARVVFKVQATIDSLKAKVFHPQVIEPPPKLPPQFFTPPKTSGKTPTLGLVPLSGGVRPTTPSSGSTGVAQARVLAPATAATPSAPASVSNRLIEGEKVKARVMPTTRVPRRVRVIRRVRKPVRVSLLNEQMFAARIDIPRRRFTFLVFSLLFGALFGGSFALLRMRGTQAAADFSEVQQRLVSAQTQGTVGQGRWSTYRDLEPRLRALSQLLDRHLSPSRVFDALEANTSPNVYYSSFALSPDGQVVLLATASSFEEAARQVTAFQRAGIATAVKAMGYQARYAAQTNQLEGVSFQIGLTLDPRVLLTDVSSSTTVTAH